MERYFVSEIIKRGYRKPLLYPSELQKVFIILDEESKGKIKDKLSLPVEPDICHYLVRINGKDGYDCAYMRSENPIAT